MILVFWWRIERRFEQLEGGFSWFFFSRVFYFAKASTMKKKREDYICIVTAILNHNLII